MGASGSFGSSKLMNVAKPELSFEILPAPSAALPARRVPDGRRVRAVAATGRARTLGRTASRLGALGIRPRQDRAGRESSGWTSSEARPTIFGFALPLCFFGLRFFFLLAGCAFSSGEPATV